MITAESVKKALNAIKRGADYAFFFENLHSVEWIDHLEREGLFASPPAPKRDGQYIQFPDWPASRYLSRMARKDPNRVASLIKRITKTDNPRVHEDFADAALAMPVGLSADVVELAGEWLRNPNQLLLSKKLEKLVCHLARGGQVKAAFALADRILEILPDTDPPRKRDAYLKPEPKPRLTREWDYQEVIKHVRPVLFEADPKKTLDFFSSLLARALELSKRSGDKTPFEDYSSIWFDDVAKNDIGFKDMLVSVVRDTAIAMAEARPSGLDEIVEDLDGRSWVIFRRIALFLLRRFDQASVLQITKRLNDRELFDKEWREYKLLARDKFGLIPKDQQKVYFEWVDAGPDMKYFSDLTPEKQEKAKQYWQAERLGWIEPHLTPEKRQFLASLKEAAGEPEPPDAPTMISWTGPTSPKSTEELKSMKSEEIITYLQKWQPPEKDMADSREGLGRALSPVVTADPAKFAVLAESFMRLDPTYVRALLMGFESAVKEERTFEWEKVLDLCKWVLSQPKEIPDRKVSEHYLSSDSDWGWTRKHIANLIEVGCQKSKVSIPFSLREKVKGLLECLIEDPEPSLQDEQGKEKMDPLTSSLNTVRGQAMHAVIKYALWVHNSFLEQGIPKDTLRQEGFKKMPEVGRILEDRLSIEKEPTSTIRAVFGQWFPWISLVDPQWARHHADTIFGQESNQHVLGDVAWGIYLRANQPYDEVFEILQRRYALAVKQLGKQVAEKPTDEEEALAHHLMVLAWRGKLLIDGSDSLWTTFWVKASPLLRGECIEFIGRSFYQTKAEAKAEFVANAKAIWNQRIQYAKLHEEEVRTSNELSGFGWWFASGQFGNDWALPQLVGALKCCTKPDTDHFIMERLAPVAKDWPLAAIQILTGLINLDREGWGMAAWANEARQVIQAARDSDDPKAREMAIDLIHRLGALGHLEFRDLLPK